MEPVDAPSPPAVVDDGLAYVLFTRLLTARSVYKKSVKSHVRSLNTFAYITIRVGKARIASPRNLPRLRHWEARETRAAGAMTCTVHAMNDAHERLYGAERTWEQFSRACPEGHVFTFQRD